MKHIGVIDIGSNSVRLLLTEITDKHSFKIITELKEYVRLGEGFDNNGNLKEEKIQETIKVLKLYKNFCDAFPETMIITTATEAVRKTKNQSYLIGRIKSETGLDVEILSGEKEAYYDYFASINTLNVKNALILDIGGASTEIILVNNRNLKECISLPFGAITLTRKFNLQDSISSAEEKNLKSFLFDSFSSITWLKDLKIDTLIGIGGSIRNIAKISKKRTNYPLNLIHNYTLDSNEVLDIYNEVKSKSTEQRKKIKGLSKDRADIFVGAVCAVNTLINMLKIKHLIISRNGLREGVLLGTLFNKEKVEDILGFSINNILANNNINPKHSSHVYKLTLALFNELKPLHRLDDYLINVIRTSSMLHDIGNNISYYYHHKHSTYIILNSIIYGLTPRERVMSAFAASYHRSDNIPADFDKYKSLLDKVDIFSIKVIGLLIRIAENLDKDLSNSIMDVKCTMQDDMVIIKTVSNAHSDFLVNQAQAVSDSFKELLGKKLYVV